MASLTLVVTSLFPGSTETVLAQASANTPAPSDVIVYKSIGDLQLKLHVFHPAKHRQSDKRPAIVFFFGGGWNGGSIKQFYPQCSHLAARGMVAVCADYRVKSRHKTTPKECVADGKSAVRWIRSHAGELGVDPKRIAAGGGSAGGHVAAATALVKGFDDPSDDTSIDCRPNALVLFNPVVDNGPDGFGYDRVKDYWKSISPLHNIQQGAPPTLFLLGTKDKLIPVSMAKGYVKDMQAAGARCDLRLYEGSQHGFFNQGRKNSRYRETMSDVDKFLDSLEYTDDQQPLELAQAEEGQSTSRDSKMAWWREARFGMFVHWGIYSVVGGEYKGQKLPNSAEWMMCRGKIPIAEYEKYAAQFNPTKFDADEFVARAKNAGMKYLVITAKHHDGFAMFGSKATRFNVVDATPCKRDIIAELSKACQKQGMRLGFYYSQAQDWHHPGGMGNNWDKSLKRVSNDEYVQQKAYPEAKQLLTEYGPISIFWWDTPRKMSKQALDSLYATRELQPGLITNDRLGKGYPGDHKSFERKIPAQGPAGGEDWEVCMPISGSWGFKLGDNKFKSTSKLIRNLADIASKGGNYLLNVSPTGDGTLLPQAVERLEAIGEWMKVNGESIYGTTASPLAKLKWGRCTQKKTADGTTLYLHVFDWPENGEIMVPGLKSQTTGVYLLANGERLDLRHTDDGVIVSVPNKPLNEINTVIALQAASPLEIERQVASSVASNDGVITLEAESAFLHNNEGSRDVRVRGEEGNRSIGYWTDPHASVEWSFEIKRAGTYEILAELAIESANSSFLVEVAKQKLPVRAKSTGGYGNYEKRKIGNVSIGKTGSHSMTIRPDVSGWQPVNVRRVTLKEVK
ncbi:MAG: alpha-L-fucosidase [Planctomycetota bacterium]